MGLLQRVGRVEDLGSGAARGRAGLAARSEPPVTGSPERSRVVERQRQSASGRRRADVPECRAAGTLAKSYDFLGERQAGCILRGERSEDDRTLRLGSAVVLAAGQYAWWRLGIQH